MDDNETPVKGKWADHKSGKLDPREVAEVSEDGSMIRLYILSTTPTDWLLAKNYTYSAGYPTDE